MIREIRDNVASFLGTFVLVFVISFAILFALGFAPFRVESFGSTGDAGSSPARMAPAGQEFPSRVVIGAIGVDAFVSNPAESDVETLDKALLSGAVRYPGSARLNEDGTVYLFAHSSFLKIVHNSAYRTFNNIQKLSPGSEIHVYSATSDYVYRVTSVLLVDAERALVDLSAGKGAKLVLSTCDSFGAKSQRFVVEADFAGRSPLLRS